MRRTAFVFMIILVLEIVALTIFPQLPWAEKKHDMGQREEYKSTAKQTKLLQDDLAVIKGKEANIIAVKLPPGWIGEKHYHTGDVFVYVQEGKFIVDVEGEDRKSFGPGEVYHEAVNKVMQARNGSQTIPTKILLFQVGDKGEPLMIKAE